MSQPTRFSDPETGQIIAFLKRIGIRVEIRAVGEDSFLPGLAVQGGSLIVDPDSLEWPGDLLHEAGHIAVTDPAERAALDLVSDDPGDEMAAIAWSYAAAVEIGLDRAVLFHSGGYRGASRAFIENFESGRYIGVPLLACYDMTAEPHVARKTGEQPFPTMARWLR